MDGSMPRLSTIRGREEERRMRGRGWKNRGGGDGVSCLVAAGDRGGKTKRDYCQCKPGCSHTSSNREMDFPSLLRDNKNDQMLFFFLQILPFCVSTSSGGMLSWLIVLLRAQAQTDWIVIISKNKRKHRRCVSLEKTRLLHTHAYR